MHLQQTKLGSRKSGGPQYYFHDVPDPIKDFLRRRGACRVILQTPYGIAASAFTAVGRDHRLTRSGRAVRGRVGHDRIQQATEAHESIGEAIRRWYGLPRGLDFKRIDVDVSLHHEGHFILSPQRVTLRGGRSREIDRPLFPLSLNDAFQSSLWRRQIGQLCDRQPDSMQWACEQINNVVAQHVGAEGQGIHEADLLRVSGALAKLGMNLGPYGVRHYDCTASTFSFLGLPTYVCPVEIKRHSRGFRYQMLRYAPLPRAVVLCLHHDLRNPPEHVDIVELSYMAEYLRRHCA